MKTLLLKASTKNLNNFQIIFEQTSGRIVLLNNFWLAPMRALEGFLSCICALRTINLFIQHVSKNSLVKGVNKHKLMLHRAGNSNNNHEFRTKIAGSRVNIDICIIGDLRFKRNNEILKMMAKKWLRDNGSHRKFE